MDEDLVNFVFDPYGSFNDAESERWAVIENDNAVAAWLAVLPEWDIA